LPKRNRFVIAGRAARAATVAPGLRGGKSVLRDRYGTAASSSTFWFLPGADDDTHLDILSDFTEEDRSRINRVITKIGNIPSGTEPSERLHIVLVRDVPG
jgi:hypothetical protein